MDTVFSPPLRFPRWLWLMPAAFSLHICEEWFGHWRDYVITDMHGPAMPGPLFLANNAAFMLILVGLSVWTVRTGSRAATFTLLSWATGNLFWDFVVHFAYTIGTKHFSPGLVTATLLYYPIPFLVSWMALREGFISRRALIGAYAVGFVLMGLVLWGGLYHFAV